MPNIKYALKSNEPTRLEISWKGIWKNVKVLLDGDEIGTFTNMGELKKGKEFVLKDKSVLKVQLSTKFTKSGLEVSLDNKPLPGSISDPAERFKILYVMLYLMSGINLIFGTITYFFQTELLQQEFGANLFSIFFGLTLLILGFVIQRTKSMVILALAIGMHVLDTVISIIIMNNLGKKVPISGVIFHIIILLYLAQGFSTIKKLKEQKNI